MKKNKTTYVDHRTYKNDKAEQENREFPRDLLRQTEQKAKRDAEDELPQNGDRLETYLATINGEIQAQNDRNRDHFGADETTTLTSKKFQNQLSDERNNRDELEQIAKQKTQECERLSTDYPTFIAMIVASFILALCITEGLLLKSALRVILPNAMTALIAASTIGAGLSILAHKIAVWWQAGKTRFTRILIRISIIGGFSFLFYFFGILRSYQQKLSTLSVEATTNMDMFSLADPKEAFFFMALSWLVFSIAIILTPYSPTFEQWKSIFRLSAKKRELKKAQENLATSRAKVTDIQEELDNLEQWDYSRKKKAERIEQSLIKLITLAKDTYVSTNLKYRRGNQRPDCFDDKSYKYYLTTYFQNKDNNINL